MYDKLTLYMLCTDFWSLHDDSTVNYNCFYTLYIDGDRLYQEASAAATQRTLDFWTPERMMAAKERTK